MELSESTIYPFLEHIMLDQSGGGNVQRQLGENRL
jgi:hypothetical protein